MRRLLLVGLVALVAVACAGPNWSGEGRGFVVVGEVLSTGDHSVKIRVLSVESAEGSSAQKHLAVGETERIHDNYNRGGLCFTDCRKWVGEVVTSDGLPLTLDDLPEGATVRVVGARRDNQNGKVTEVRSVFERVVLLSVP